MISPANSAAQFMITQQVSRHASAVHSWAQRTTAMRALLPMAREAAHPPQPGHLVRGMGALTNPNLTRARMQIEEAILKAVAQTDDPQILRQALPLLQGHYPRAARAANDRLQGR